MSNAKDQISSAVVTRRFGRSGRTADATSTPWAGLPAGPSRFDQVRRQLRVLQVERAVYGGRAA